MNDGGPAFPVPYSTTQDGMSLRDWLAGQALQGILASGYAKVAGLPMFALAQDAVAAADATMQALRTIENK